MTQLRRTLAYALTITLLSGSPVWAQTEAQAVAPASAPAAAPAQPAVSAAPPVPAPAADVTTETSPPAQMTGIESAIPEETAPVASAPAAEAAPAPAAPQATAPAVQTAPIKAIPTTPLNISDESQAIEAFAISQGINAVVEKVKTSDCPERIQAAPAAALTCPCQFTEEIATLRAAYDAALAAHPEWKDRLLSFKEPVTRSSVTLGMAGIRTQLASCGPRAL